MWSTFMIAPVSGVAPQHMQRRPYFLRTSYRRRRHSIEVRKPSLHALPRATGAGGIDRTATSLEVLHGSRAFALFGAEKYAFSSRMPLPAARSGVPDTNRL